MGQDKGPATNCTLIGSNNLIGLGGAVVTVTQQNGQKAQLLAVERHLERGGDGKLLTKTRRNKPGHADTSLSWKKGPDSVELVGPEGLAAGVRVLDNNRSVVNGDFYVGGVRVKAMPHGTTTGGLTLVDNTFGGVGDAIHFGY